MRMTRYWMTGCVALMLLAAGRWPLREEVESGQNERQRPWIALTSKYDLDETVRQIERSLKRNGLPVVASVEARSPSPGDGQGGTPCGARVLVLGDAGGRTPLMQAEGQITPEAPWKLLVQRRGDGRTEVLLADQAGVALPDDIAPETLHKVSVLPQVVKNAIT